MILSSKLSLANPNLAHPFLIDCIFGRMQHSRVDCSIHLARKKDHCSAALGNDSNPQLAKECSSSFFDVIQVNQYSGNALPTCAHAFLPARRTRVKGIKMLAIKLTILVSTHLNLFHVTRWLAQQR